jgi:hypothetical protein
MLGQLGNEATRLDGQATQTIDPSSNPEKNMKKLDKAIVKLLKNYLPKTEVEVTTVLRKENNIPDGILQLNCRALRQIQELPKRNNCNAIGPPGGGDQ